MVIKLWAQMPLLDQPNFDPGNVEVTQVNGFWIRLIFAVQ